MFGGGVGEPNDESGNLLGGELESGQLISYRGRIFNWLSRM